MAVKHKIHEDKATEDTFIRIVQFVLTLFLGKMNHSNELKYFVPFQFIFTKEKCTKNEVLHTTSFLVRSFFKFGLFIFLENEVKTN